MISFSFLFLSTPPQSFVLLHTTKCASAGADGCLPKDTLPRMGTHLQPIDYLTFQLKTGIKRSSFAGRWRQQNQPGFNVIFPFTSTNGRRHELCWHLKSLAWHHWGSLWVRLMTRPIDHANIGVNQNLNGSGNHVDPCYSVIPPNWKLFARKPQSSPLAPS